MHLEPATRIIAGAILLTIVGIEFGGWFLTRVVSGKVEMTDFQKAFARAGHAHAGVLVTLSLVILVLADLGGVDGTAGWLARLGAPIAAATISGGFFAASGHRDATSPNRFMALVWFGALSLAVSVVSLGFALITG